MKLNSRMIMACMALAAIMVTTSGAAPEEPLRTRSMLASEICADPDLPVVLEKASDLLETGLTAGSGYGEVWIRDLNTFIEVSLEVNPPAHLRSALLTFFKFQEANGDIPDGFIPEKRGSVSYKYRRSALAPGLLAHKNTVETDQETSPFLALGGIAFAGGADSKENLWALGRRHQDTHRFSTLFTAHDVKNHLSKDEGIEQAIDWCRRTAVTKVFIESFRDGYQAERAALQHAKERFITAGFEVAGCVTPTQVGKKSTGWNIIACYTDLPTQARIEAIFDFTASVFDEIMIDDFWFTDCACAECDAARQARNVTIGRKSYPVSGLTWEDYRGELMVRLSRDRVLDTAKRVNPNVRLIIKYPQWYDAFHERGYDVARETVDFDRIWVGTETRDFADPKWGGTVPYEAYFIMRWLGNIGGNNCGGGWYDWLGTTERTYIEQARQTVLAGARESLLFCYGGLQGTTGPKNIDALRSNIPELLEVSAEVRRREVIGLAAYKPPNSHPENEKRVFDFVGMVGLPLVPCHEFPAKAPAAFFSVHALKDPEFTTKLAEFIRADKPVLLTDGLAGQLINRVNLDAPNVRILPVKGDPKSLLQLTQRELDELRAPLLRPFHAAFKAPNQVALYLFRDGSWVVENFTDEAVAAELNGQALTVAGRGWQHQWKK